MEPLGWQIVSSLVDGRTLVRNIPERRLLSQAVLRIGAELGLFLFAVPDTHLHQLTTASREVAGELARATEKSLRARLDLPVRFAGARITPIRDQRHLINSVQYILGNGKRHGNHTDPRCEGTNLPDLLGLRLTGRYTAGRLRELLPRLTRQDLLKLLPIDQLRQGNQARFLPEATAAALGLPDLTRPDGQTRGARIAAVHVADALGLRSADTARLLGIAARTLRRYRKLAAQPLLVNAIRLQMGLMEDTVRVQP